MNFSTLSSTESEEPAINLLTSAWKQHRLAWGRCLYHKRSLSQARCFDCQWPKPGFTPDWIEDLDSQRGVPILNQVVICDDDLSWSADSCWSHQWKGSEEIHLKPFIYDMSDTEEGVTPGQLYNNAPGECSNKCWGLTSKRNTKLKLWTTVDRRTKSRLISC